MDINFSDLEHLPDSVIEPFRYFDPTTGKLSNLIDHKIENSIYTRLRISNYLNAATNIINPNAIRLPTNIQELEFVKEDIAWIINDIDRNALETNPNSLPEPLAFSLSKNLYKYELKREDHPYNNVYQYLACFAIAKIGVAISIIGGLMKTKGACKFQLVNIYQDNVINVPESIKAQLNSRASEDFISASEAIGMSIAIKNGENIWQMREEISELTQMAERGDKVIKGAMSGGKEKAKIHGYEQHKDKMQKEINRLHKKNPRLKYSDLKRKVAEHFNCSTKTVDRHTKSPIK